MTRLDQSILPPLAARRLRSSAVVLLCAGFLMAVMGCLSDKAANPATSSDPESRTQQIAALEESIARDRRSLEALVTEPRSEEAGALHSDAVLREIAERITAETRLLERLRSQPDEAAHTD